jgi:hypothetical protein
MKEPIFTKVSFETDDGQFTVSEWDEQAGLIQIVYKETGIEDTLLPVLTKDQWETLKRVGDFVCSEIHTD